MPWYLCYPFVSINFPSFAAQIYKNSRAQICKNSNFFWRWGGEIPKTRDPIYKISETEILTSKVAKYQGVKFTKILEHNSAKNLTFFGGGGRIFQNGNNFCTKNTLNSKWIPIIPRHTRNTKR